MKPIVKLLITFERFNLLFWQYHKGNSPALCVANSKTMELKFKKMSRQNDNVPQEDDYSLS